ncbi:MAG: lytic transglycosylase domain-containing protein [Alphaproteobacteria bacterium]
MSASGFDLGLGDINAARPAQMPRLLSTDDASRYRRIFDIQEEGDWGKADELIAGLKDRILLGHVLFQRYMHPTRYRSSYEELRSWMTEYRDHPDAERVYELALRRKPKDAPGPRAPDVGAPPPDVAGTPVGAKSPPRIIVTLREAQLSGRVNDLIGKGLNAEAEKALYDGVDAVSVPAFDRMRADIAMAYYVANDNGKAYELASAGAFRSSDSVSVGHWVAGLSAFRLGDLRSAVLHFEQHSLSPAALSWNVAAGAYWAARVHLRLRQPVQAEHWLRRAAEHPRTFYGLIARRALGLDSALDWSEPSLTRADVERVMSIPGGRRAIALAEVGQTVLAEEELRAHIWKIGHEHARSLLAVADAIQLPHTAVRAGSRLAQFGDSTRDRALYPTPPWTPVDGFKIDRALIYAFMRQESQFRTRATSPVGARGLMQLMPATATSLTEEYDFTGKTQEVLYEPQLNVTLGQQYLTWLLERGEVDGNLFKLAVAYNAGPGNLRRWERNGDFRDDPLLFIESLPARQTRIFVERVLSNFWIYRQRMGQPNPSLDAVAAGEWPRYAPLDAPSLNLAQNVRN